MQVRRTTIVVICTLLAVGLLAIRQPVSAQSGPTAVVQGDTTVANGATFTVDIVVQPDPSFPVGVAQAYLQFDQNYLQVVSGSNPSGPLIPGPVFDSS
jgi:hypothetical protein